MPDFNKGQLEAIHHINGPMLALAGPGSGKTTAIVYRIKYLIEKANHQIDSGYKVRLEIRKCLNGY